MARSAAGVRAYFKRRVGCSRLTVTADDYDDDGDLATSLVDLRAAAGSLDASSAHLVGFSGPA